MARQPRFVLAGHPHLIEQQGHNGAPIALDEDDRHQWLALLRDAAAAHRVVLHAWSLRADRFALLATPPTTEALGRMMQTLGRRYVGGFNARHQRSGTLWDGRYRCCLVEEGPWALVAMHHVEAVGGEANSMSSLGHHLGQTVDPSISDLRAYWALGNTPFDRHAAYRARIDTGASAAEHQAVARAIRSGRPLGSPAYLAGLQRETGTLLVPRPRGRPARKPLS